MKINLTTPYIYKPRVLEITIETEQEYHALEELFGRSITIPEQIFAPNTTNYHLLSNLMERISLKLSTPE